MVLQMPETGPAGQGNCVMNTVEHAESALRCWESAREYAKCTRRRRRREKNGVSAPWDRTKSDFRVSWERVLAND